VLNLRSDLEQKLEALGFSVDVASSVEEVMVMGLKTDLFLVYPGYKMEW